MFFRGAPLLTTYPRVRWNRGEEAHKCDRKHLGNAHRVARICKAKPLSNLSVICTFATNLNFKNVRVWEILFPKLAKK